MPLGQGLRAYGLMYHDVVTGADEASGRVGAGPDRYKLTWDSFYEHLEVMDRVLLRPPTVEQDRLGGWSLTFDDGGISSLVVGEELARRGWKAFFLTTTGLLGQPGFLEEDGVREIRRMGHVVGSHSVSHPSWMAFMPEEQLLREWRESAAHLAGVLGEAVTTASVPGGSYGRRVARAATQAGIRTLFTSKPVRTARLVEGCLVVGRYTIRQGTGAEGAARAARGDVATWLAQYAGWYLRAPAKRLGRRRYDGLRNVALGRSRRGRG